MLGTAMAPEIRDDDPTLPLVGGELEERVPSCAIGAPAVHEQEDVGTLARLFAPDPVRRSSTVHLDILFMPCCRRRRAAQRRPRLQAPVLRLFRNALPATR